MFDNNFREWSANEKLKIGKSDDKMKVPTRGPPNLRRNGYNKIVNSPDLAYKRVAYKLNHCHNCKYYGSFAAKCRKYNWDITTAHGYFGIKQRSDYNASLNMVCDAWTNEETPIVDFLDKIIWWIGGIGAILLIGLAITLSIVEEIM